MFCPNCGREVDDKAAVCVGCGRSLPKLNNNVGEQDSNSAGWWWLGFFIPVAGFIIWLVSSGTTPKKARKAGIGALVGIITSVVLFIAFYVIMFLLGFFMAAGANSYYF
ncbi:MAG: zinc-ribbon domain-containing protein [Clostridia bacterium]|nr:zinc-ribbon domain-containing protein [Clostridia bacterium]